MTIGRIGVATASGGDGFTLYEASGITQTDNQMTLSGIQGGLTDVQLTWMRDQFLGLVHGFEPTIPVTSTTWPALDGYYTVTGVTADRTPGALAWSVNLTRPADWRSPRVDQFAVYGLLTNAVGVTATSSYFFAPPDITQWSKSRVSLRTTSDGASEVSEVSASSSSSGAVTYPSYTVPIASCYKGSARVTYDPNNDGTTRLVIGRKGVTTRLEDLIITNGLVQVNVSSDDILANWYSGDGGAAGTYESLVNMNLRAGTNGLLTFDSASVIQNTPECVTVRYSSHPAIGLGSGFFSTVDVSVRRGSRTVSMYAQSSGTAAWALEGVSFPAMTAVGTHSVRYTSNDSDGNRVFMSATSGAADAANKKVGVPSARADFNCGFGFELNGSSSTSHHSVTDQIQDYFNPVTTTERIATL